MGDPQKFGHSVVVVCDGQAISDWTSYQIESSMIMPADAFTLTRAFSLDAWRQLRRDARVKVFIDGVCIVNGFIDRRRKKSKDDSMTIEGRDQGGRLVQETAPSINYEDLLMSEAIRRLVDPWYPKVTLVDARNRDLRRGKGRRVPGGNEPIIVNIRVPRTGKVHPGMTRWQIIEEIVSTAGYVAYGSADGREFFVGKPNYSQAPQYLIAHPRRGSTLKSTCKELDWDEDNGDRYSIITCAGVGGDDEDNYGENVTDRRGIAVDNEGTVDGVGRDFIYPKRLYMPERDFDSNGDAVRVAERERARRDFRRTIATAKMPGHGQFIVTANPTIFAPNTIARVIDEEIEVDDPYLIVSCSYEGDRTNGQTTSLELVPSGTEIVL